MDLFFSNNQCAAFLAQIIESFLRPHPRGYLGRTALQKLTYFCQALGVPIPCSFEIYNYGPYSDEVKFAVDSLIADEVVVDTSPQPRYSNYELATNHSPFVGKMKKAVATHDQTIERVVELFGGFSPLQLELIATLHFIAKRHKGINGMVNKQAVLDDFEAVKQDKFDRSEVASWYESLRQANLI